MPKIKIKNLNTEINRRIKLIKTQTSVVDIGQQQGAVVNQSDYVGICLSPLELPVISCDGATPTLHMTGCRGIWDFYLNDEFILNGVPNDFTYWIGNNKQGELWADWDGFLGFNLLDLSKTFRFRMVPVEDTSYTPPTDNPTFMELENGDLVWCLAQSNQLGCEGAVDHITVGTITGGGLVDVYLDDILIPVTTNFFFRNGGAADYLNSIGITIRPLQADGSPATDFGGGNYYDADRGSFLNTTDEYHKIRFELIDANSVDDNFTPENGSFEYNPETNITTFCLSPQSNQISCDGATPTADTGGIWGNVTMTVNGTPHESVEPIPDVLRLVRDGELHFIFKNLSDQYLRIHITSDGLNGNDFGWGENQNPTRGVDFGAGTIDFCLAPAGCEPTEFTMVDNNLFEGGSVRLDYIIDAPNQGINNVSKRYSMTDIAQGTWLSDITRDVIAQIKSDHLFISFKEGIGNEVANFSLSTYRSTIIGQFYLLGAPDEISSDPITIKFVKNGYEDDLFPLLFPDAAADGITEYSVHSCGTMDWPGI